MKTTIKSMMIIGMMSLCTVSTFGISVPRTTGELEGGYNVQPRENNMPRQEVRVSNNRPGNEPRHEMDKRHMEHRHHFVNRHGRMECEFCHIDKHDYDMMMHHGNPMPQPVPQKHFR